MRTVDRLSRTTLLLASAVLAASSSAYADLPPRACRRHEPATLGAQLHDGLMAAAHELFAWIDVWSPKVAVLLSTLAELGGKLVVAVWQTALPGLA